MSALLIMAFMCVGIHSFACVDIHVLVFVTIHNAIYCTIYFVLKRRELKELVWRIVSVSQPQIWFVGVQKGGNIFTFFFL